MDHLLAHDQRFFTALTSADTAALDALLHPDFLLVAVDSGAELLSAQGTPVTGQ